MILTEVILKGVGNVMLYDSTRQRVTIFVCSLEVTLFGEETKVVAFGCNNHGEQNLNNYQWTITFKTS